MLEATGRDELETGGGWGPTWDCGRGGNPTANLWTPPPCPVLETSEGTAGRWKVGRLRPGLAKSGEVGDKGGPYVYPSTSR